MINTIVTLLAIAGGGAFGALARYGVNIGAVKLLGHGFPYATLMVNIIGSFLMGVAIIVFASVWHPSDTVRLLTITGFLGAFTTFSTFSLDFALMIEKHNYAESALYLGASVILSIAALFAGMALIRMVITA